MVRSSRQVGAEVELCGSVRRGELGGKNSSDDGLVMAEGDANGIFVMLQHCWAVDILSSALKMTRMWTKPC
jgi:hypothetical protein